MLYIHKSVLPKKVQSTLKEEPDWLEGYVLFFACNTTADFLDKQGRALFQFSRPVVITHSEKFMRYAAFVLTGTNKMGATIGELRELTFYFDLLTKP